MSRRYARVYASIFCAWLSACSSTPSKQTPQLDAPEEQIVTPQEATLRFDRAVSLLGAGDLQQAEKEFRSLHDEYPLYFAPLANLGAVYLKRDRPVEAEAALRAALEIEPNNAPVLNQLGIVYRMLGKFSDAEAAYLRAVEVDGNYAPTYRNLGVLCDLYLQQPKRALEAFERYQTTVQSDPKVAAWVQELRTRMGIDAASGATSNGADARGEP